MKNIFLLLAVLSSSIASYAQDIFCKDNSSYLILTGGDQDLGCQGFYYEFANWNVYVPNAVQSRFQNVNGQSFTFYNANVYLKTA